MEGELMVVNPRGRHKMEFQRILNNGGISWNGIEKSLQYRRFCLLKISSLLSMEVDYGYLRRW